MWFNFIISHFSSNPNIIKVFLQNLAQFLVLLLWQNWSQMTSLTLTLCLCQVPVLLILEHLVSRPLAVLHLLHPALLLLDVNFKLNHQGPTADKIWDIGRKVQHNVNIFVLFVVLFIVFFLKLSLTFNWILRAFVVLVDTMKQGLKLINQKFQNW